MLWTTDGIWQKILAEVIVKDDSIGAVERLISVYSTVIRAHQQVGGQGESDKQCNVVERCFNQLQQFRDMATRDAGRAASYQAELIIAATVPWLR